MDIVRPLETTRKGNSYLLTIQDDLSKFSLVIPLPNHTANTIARAFVENVIRHHGLPESVLTDQVKSLKSVVNY
jgi:transposase-like protein